MYDIFNMLLDSVCLNFVGDFSIYVHQCYWPVVFFFVWHFLSGFGIRVMVASQNEFGSLPSLTIFQKSLSRIGISSSLNFWQNSPVKPSGPRLLFVGRFFYYSLNFHACDGSVKILYFFLVQFWKVILFQEFVHFFQVVHFICI